MEMQNKLVEYFSRFQHLSATEKEAITSDMVISEFKAKTLLLREGQFPLDNFFILAGCVRQYYLKDGEEKITNFYIEEEWILPAIGMAGEAPVNYYLECTEDTVLVVANEDKGNDLLKKFPKFQSLSQIILEKEILKQQTRMVTYHNSTPEERYLNLQKEQPSLVQRIPQYQLASYIGIKPESFSRIRKRLNEKRKT